MHFTVIGFCYPLVSKRDRYDCELLTCRLTCLENLAGRGRHQGKLVLISFLQHYRVYDEKMHTWRMFEDAGVET